MFQSLRASLNKVQKNIQNRQTANTLARRVVTEYLTETFGVSGQTISITVSYDESQKQLTIETQSKTLSSELLLRSGELAALLRQSGMTLKRLLVR
jgi:hypothetical protein